MSKTMRNIICYGLLIILSIAAIVAGPEVGSPIEAYGFWSAIPVLFIFTFIIITTRTIEGFLWATVLACVIKYKGLFFQGTMDEIQLTFQDPDSIWLFLIFALAGVLFMILNKSGAGTFFARAMAKFAKSAKVSLLFTWILPTPLCIDDYMSMLTVGACMSPVNDEFKVPREMTAYVVRSAGAPPACFLPIGAWAIFVASLLEANGMAETGAGVATYLTKVMPFLFFPMAGMLVSLLVILGVIPKFGRMKKAFERVEAGGPVSPIVEGEEVGIEEATEPRPGVNLIHFLVPIVLIFLFAFFVFDLEMLYSMTAGIAVTLIFYVATKVFSIMDAISAVYEGFNYMCEMLVMLIFGFSLCRLVSELGFTEYVVGLAESVVTPALFPVIIFLVFAISEFFVSFNYTLYMIAMPIVIALAEALGANPYVGIAALVSAGVWGYLACFSADGGILVSGACSLSLYEENMAQIPYMVIALVLAALGYLVAGLVL